MEIDQLSAAAGELYGTFEDRVVPTEEACLTQIKGGKVLKHLSDEMKVPEPFLTRFRLALA